MLPPPARTRGQKSDAPFPLCCVWGRRSNPAEELNRSLSGPQGEEQSFRADPGPRVAGSLGLEDRPSIGLRTRWVQSLTYSWGNRPEAQGHTGGRSPGP